MGGPLLALLGSTTNVRSTEQQRKFLKGMGSSVPDPLRTFLLALAPKAWPK
jgi:hypothetical protein